METVKNYFFREIGIMFGRSMLQILRRVNSITTVTIVPIAFMLLLVYIVGGVILTVEELLNDTT